MVKLEGRAGMGAGGERTKVAILGGGVAGLATAFELTSAPGWDEQFEVTIYQMGWRAGGKCASSRGEGGRIEEHGIHAFLGAYYNALPMMAACYEELNRIDPESACFLEGGGRPHHAFEPGEFALFWEWRDGRMVPWTQTFPANGRHPAHPPHDLPAFENVLRAVLSGLEPAVAKAGFSPPLKAVFRLATRFGFANPALASLRTPVELGPAHPLTRRARGLRRLIQCLLPLIAWSDKLRRFSIALDYLLTLIVGAMEHNVAANGYDGLDEQNWSDWLKSSGALDRTIASPLALNNINILFQYPDGDTTRPPRMAAGCYLHWCLRVLAYNGAFEYRFTAGSGETLIAPLYQVLAHRGVKFAFFHKIEALRLSDDGRRIEAVEYTLQRPAPPGGYEPLERVTASTGRTLKIWPSAPPPDPRAAKTAEPVAGEAPPDLETYWTGEPLAKAAPRPALRLGEDFDQVVFAISLGAVPHLCEDLMKQSQAWRDMVAHVPAICTQAMQLWFTKPTPALGFRIHHARGDFTIGPNYFSPMSGQADFTRLLKLEALSAPDGAPAAGGAKSLWYFCGPLALDEEEPSFDDAAFPVRQKARVKAAAMQTLQCAMTPLFPDAMVGGRHLGSDPVGFDFDLLYAPQHAPGTGIARFEAQYWRANIDPSERYVTSPPGSTAYRLQAWDSGFDNLVLAGDWIYTGLNVGSVEGTVMGAKLACLALTGRPHVSQILGYPDPPPPGRSSPPTVPRAGTAAPAVPATPAG